jgi:hypothetical protein
VPGKPGDWQDKPPAFLEGDVMLVVTAVKPGAEFALEVTEVSGEAECEEDEETTPTTLGDCGAALLRSTTTRQPRPPPRADAGEHG